jgi:NADH:ubiquinone oxidoreductase subunit 3 (subunit A)
MRFWRRSRDQLFLTFAIAFVLLSLQQALLVFLGVPEEERGWIYILRLIAFLAIIIAVVRKNLDRS